MDVPHVKREDYQLTDISDDGYLCLMTDSGDLREDLKIPEGDLGTQLRSEYDAGKELLVSIINCMSDMFQISFDIDCNFLMENAHTRTLYVISVHRTQILWRGSCYCC